MLLTDMRETAELTPDSVAAVNAILDTLDSIEGYRQPYADAYGNLRDEFEGELFTIYLHGR
jgi:hypothetical protein